MDIEGIKIWCNVVGFALNAYSIFSLMNLGYVGINEIRNSRSVMPRLTSTLTNQPNRNDTDDLVDNINREIRSKNAENNHRTIKSRRWQIAALMGTFLQLLPTVL